MERLIQNIGNLAGQIATESLQKMLIWVNNSVTRVIHFTTCASEPHLMEMLPTPFRSVFARMAIKYGEVPLTTHTAEVYHKGICIFHGSTLSPVIMNPNLIRVVVRKMLIQCLDA
jgi:hypothetical protein